MAFTYMQILQDDKKCKFVICTSNILPFLILILDESVKTPPSEMSDKVNALRSNIFEMEILFKPI